MHQFGFGSQFDILDGGAQVQMRAGGVLNTIEEGTNERTNGRRGVGGGGWQKETATCD